MKPIAHLYWISRNYEPFQQKTLNLNRFTWLLWSAGFPKWGCQRQRWIRRPIFVAIFSLGSARSGCKGRIFISGHILTMNIMSCFSTLYCVWQFLPVNFFCTTTIILCKTCGSNSWWQTPDSRTFKWIKYKDINTQKRKDFVTFFMESVTQTKEVK